MRLTPPNIVPGDFPGQVRQIRSWLIAHVRELDAILTSIQKELKNRGLNLEEIIDGILISERFLDRIYNYCENRRKKEEKDNAETS